MSDSAVAKFDAGSMLGRFSLPGFKSGAAKGQGAKKSGGKGWFKWSRLWRPRFIGALILAAFMLVRWSDPGWLELLRLKTFDFYQQAKPRPIPENSPVVIIDLDEASLEELGQWPWPRTFIAEMIRQLSVKGVKVIGFDMFFPEADRMSASSVAKVIPGLDEATRKRIAELPDNDDILGNMIRASRRVVAGQAVLPTPRSYGDRKQLPSRVTQLQDKGARKPIDWVTPVSGLLRNVDAIEKNAAGHGLVSLQPEPDGIVRRVPAFFSHGEGTKRPRLYPTLSLEVMRVFEKRGSIVTKAGRAGIEQVRVSKRLEVPTDRRGRMWPYFSKHDPSKYIPAKDVITGKVDASRVMGKMALVGTSAAGLIDIKTVPTERFIPGVEVHGQLIESVFFKQFLSRPAFSDTLEMAIALLGGIAIIILVPWVGAGWAFVAFAAVAAGSGFASWQLFSQQQILLDAGFAMIAILTIYLYLTVTGFVTEEAQRRQTKDAFSKYLSPAMVQQVVEDPSLLTLGGAKRDMTLLFCDVRGFTSISELFDAEGLTVLINKLLTPLTDIILARNGTIDKYMGDCIMAFWNAPLDDINHARDGCLSAIEMVKAMGPLNDRLEQEAKEEGRKHLPLKVGLGLNSGDAVVGNMGTAQRMDYSVLGDTVNTAARLEGQSKTYGVDIVLGPNTWAQVPELATIELDNIQVKGKTVGLKIYALMGDEEVAQDPEFIKVKEAVHDMIAAYLSKDWDKAEEQIAYTKEIGKPYKLDVLCELYEARVAAYRLDPPPEDWDGVFIATSK